MPALVPLRERELAGLPGVWLREPLHQSTLQPKTSSPLCLAAVQFPDSSAVNCAPGLPGGSRTPLE
eukprot:3884390-Alexandrium_andersonii.AAC.1